MAVGKGVNNLNSVTSDFTHVYFLSGDSTSYNSPDFEFPVVEGSINYNLGEVDYSYVKLCTGAVWTANKTKGDPDISFNVACNNHEVAALFGMATSKTVSLPNGSSASGTEVDLTQIKVAKGTVIFTDDSGHAEILPGCELAASRGKDEVAYWNVKVVPGTRVIIV